MVDVLTVLVISARSFRPSKQILILTDGSLRAASDIYVNGIPKSGISYCPPPHNLPSRCLASPHNFLSGGSGARMAASGLVPVDPRNAQALAWCLLIRGASGRRAPYAAFNFSAPPPC